MAAHLVNDPDRALDPEVLELADIFRETWPTLQAELRASGVLLADGDDDDSSSDDDDDDSSDDDSSDDDDDSSDDDNDDDDSSSDDDDDDDDKSEAEKRAARAEARAREESKKRRAAERKLKRQESKKKQEEGRFKEMYEEEKKKRETLEAEKRDGEVGRTVEAVAKRLKFRNPSLAVKLSDWSEAVEVEDGEIEVDEDLVERKLRAIAKDDDYLVEKKDRQSDKAGSGDRRRRNGRGQEEEVQPGTDRMRSAFKDRESRTTERVR